jgi:hypothetical protein
MSTMTKGERDQLLQLVKKRERVMRVKAQERTAVLLAEFDAQSAKVHHWDEDAVWAAVKAEADAAIEKAQIAIAGRCQQLGIPVEFAPGLQMFWHGRGHNAASDRRSELRRAAKSKLEALEREALSKIEALSLEAQTEMVANGLDSETAKAFLEAMPKIEALMPPLRVAEIQTLVEARRHERKRLDHLN